jgi:hypothetical protein
MAEPLIERRLWWAGLLIATGLAVQLAVSQWMHPLAFVTFLVVACPVVAAGIAVYLWALVAHAG